MSRAEEILQARRRIVAANGLDFEVFEAGEGDRLALLLHGFPQNALVWRRVLPLLVARGYRVWAVNQRGYGETSRPKEREAYALGPLLADVAGLIDASGATQTTLIGHDWGGLLGFAFAARRLRPLERLVVFNAPHPACFSRALQEPKQKRRSRYIGFFRLPFLPELLLGAGGAALIDRALRKGAGAVDEEIVALYRAQAARPGALTAMLNWYRAALPETLSAQDIERPFDTPTLLFWGDRDFALSRVCLDGTENYATHIEIVRLARGGHWGPEDGGAEVAAALAARL